MASLSRVGTSLRRMACRWSVLILSRHSLPGFSLPHP
nr:MAG TPA: hypothetical protein [Caudoviricetes sp.]